MARAGLYSGRTFDHAYREVRVIYVARAGLSSGRRLVAKRMDDELPAAKWMEDALALGFHVII